MGPFSAAGGEKHFSNGSACRRWRRINKNQEKLNCPTDQLADGGEEPTKTKKKKQSFPRISLQTEAKSQKPRKTKCSHGSACRRRRRTKNKKTKFSHGSACRRRRRTKKTKKNKIS